MGGRITRWFSRRGEQQMEVPGSQLVVQLPLSSFWGKQDEIEARDRLAAAIERDLGRHGCGKYDGKDTGSGTTNLYFYGIPDDAWARAVKLVVTALKRRKLTDKAVVVRVDFVPRGVDMEVVESVVWPPGGGASGTAKPTPSAPCDSKPI
jgi:hypothetical protein